MKVREKKTVSFLGFSLVAIMTVLLGWEAAEAAPVELLKNGGFEAVENGIPVGWRANNAGKLTAAPDAHTGRFAAKFESRPHEWGYSAFASAGGRVNPRLDFPVNLKATYRISVWAKGSGAASLEIYQYSQSNWIVTDFLENNKRLALTPEWQRLECVYKPTKNPIISLGRLAISLHGKDAVAYFDDVSVTFDTAENPGITVGKGREAKILLTFEVKSRDADAQLFVSGKEVSLSNGSGSIEIPEGMIPVAVRAEATGSNPGVLVKITGHPETDGRWRVGGKQENGWLEMEFDDRSWPLAKIQSDGYAWSPDKTAKNIFCRQLIIWNATHHGPNRCIVPQAKEWGFSLDGMELFHLALYSPLPYRLDDYEFSMDIPAEFRFLDKLGYQPRSVYNHRPREIIVEEVVHEGKPYIRHRFFYTPKEVTPDKTQWSILPVKMDRRPGYKKCMFYYRRSAQGNITEFEQSIPVAILPAVRGKMPEKIRIFYHSPLGNSTISKEHLEAYVKQEAAAGINSYWSSPYRWGEVWQEYQKLFRDTVTKAGGRVSLWTPFNVPLNYGYLGGYTPDFTKWFVNTPAFHGRFYRNQPAWGAKDKGPYTRPYCNQYVISEEGKEFWKRIEKEYSSLLGLMPETEIIMTDWEFHNIKKDGSGTHCFCDRCKKAFQKFAELSEGEDLSDEAIIKKHRFKWEEFRHHQDSEIQKRVQEVCHKLGKKYMVYAGRSDTGFWDQCKGKMDIPFPGWPGNNVADSNSQKRLDTTAAYFRSLGFKRIVGQQFPFHYGRGKDSWKKVHVLTNDGYVDAKGWKTRILRIVASFHQGVDLSEGLNRICAGMHYYVGEATRIISEYEDLFWDGERVDDLATSEQIKYPNLLVLKRGDERLVLLFNESTQPLTVQLQNKNVKPSQKGTIYGTSVSTDTPKQMQVTIKSEDVAVVHIK